METNGDVVPGQLIKIKSIHPPYVPFMRKEGVVTGFGEGTVLVRPEGDLSRTLELYPHEVRDTQPRRMASL